MNRQHADLETAVLPIGTTPDLEVRVGFEPTVLEICSPLHWATLPPHCSWLRVLESNHQLELMRLSRYRFSNPRLKLGTPKWNRTPLPSLKGCVLTDKRWVHLNNTTFGKKRCNKYRHARFINLFQRFSAFTRPIG